jgi:hypothetical protein
MTDTTQIQPSEFDKETGFITSPITPDYLRAVVDSILALRMADEVILENEGSRQDSHLIRLAAGAILSQIPEEYSDQILKLVENYNYEFN